MNTGKRIGLFMLFVTAAISAIPAQDRSLLDRAYSVSTMEEAAVFSRDTAVSSNAFSKLFRGIAWHNAARSDARAVDTGIPLLESAWKTQGQPLALGYLGSLLTIRAGIAAQKGNLIGATEDLSRGLSLLDESIRISPDSLDLHILRLNNSISVSDQSPADRSEAVSEDLDFLEKGLPSLPPEIKSLYYYCRGRTAIDDEMWDEGFALLEEAIRSGSGTPFAREAEKLLWQLEE